MIILNGFLISIGSSYHGCHLVKVVHYLFVFLPLLLDLSFQRLVLSLSFEQIVLKLNQFQRNFISLLRDKGIVLALKRLDFELKVLDHSLSEGV